MHFIFELIIVIGYDALVDILGVLHCFDVFETWMVTESKQMGDAKKGELEHLRKQYCNMVKYRMVLQSYILCPAIKSWLNMSHEINSLPKVIIVYIHLQHLLCMSLLGVLQFSQQVVISGH